MKSAIDTSVVVSGLIDFDDHHDACRRLLLSGTHGLHSHGLAELFSTLTGGRLGLRVPPVQVVEILEKEIARRFEIISLSAEEMLVAMAETEARGIRGGAIYDYLHLVAARKAGVKKFYTLNMSDFLSFHRPGDPEIVHP